MPLLEFRINQTLVQINNLIQLEIEMEIEISSWIRIHFEIWFETLQNYTNIFGFILYGTLSACWAVGLTFRIASLFWMISFFLDFRNFLAVLGGGLAFLGPILRLNFLKLNSKISCNGSKSLKDHISSGASAFTRFLSSIMICNETNQKWCITRKLIGRKEQFSASFAQAPALGFPAKQWCRFRFKFFMNAFEWKNIFALPKFFYFIFFI